MVVVVQYDCVWSFLFQTCLRTVSVSCQRSCASSSPWRRSACTTTVFAPSPPTSATYRLSPTSTSGNIPFPSLLQLPARPCIAIHNCSVCVCPRRCSRNLLSSLPPSMCQLPLLRVLIVSNNKLSALPTSIHTLTHLRQLVRSNIYPCLNLPTTTHRAL